MKIANVLREYLSGSNNQKEMNILSEGVVKQEDPKELSTLSKTIFSALLDSIENTTNENISTVYALNTVACTGYSLVDTQNGKLSIQTSYLPSISLKDKNYHYDVEQEKWEYIYEPGVCTDGWNNWKKQTDRLNDALKAKKDIDMSTFRHSENRKIEEEYKIKIIKYFTDTSILTCIEYINKLFEYLKAISDKNSPQANLLRELILQTAEGHLSDLQEVIKVFISQTKARPLTEEQIKILYDEIGSQISTMLGSSRPTTVTEAKSFVILTETVNILRGLQGFLKGQLNELRMTAFLQQISENTYAIRSEIGNAVSLLQTIERNTERMLYNQNELLKIEFAQLRSMVAIGRVLSSTRVSRTIGPFFTTTTRSAPVLSFAEALRGNVGRISN